MRVGAHELPDGEIGDEEELNGAKERCEADAGDGAAVAQPEADGYADEEAGVDDGDYFVEANENVSSEKREEREEESETAVFEHGAGEERHRADGREIPGMWGDAQSGSEKNQSEGEQRAIKQSFFSSFAKHFWISPYQMFRQFFWKKQIPRLRAAKAAALRSE